MKRLVLIILSLVLVVSLADARRKRDYAGTVENGVYQDSKYDFRLKVDDNWKANVGDESSNTRVVLIQKKFGIPSDYRDAADYTYIPKLIVWADTSSMSASAFLDSLLSDTYKSKQKKSIEADFDFLAQQQIIPKGKRLFTLAGETAVNWDGEAKYSKDIAASTSSDVGGGVHVNRKYHGTIIGVKHDAVVYMFHVMCEDEYRDGVLTEVKGMLDSLAWTKPKS